MRDPRILKELTHDCRLLTSILCVGYCSTVIVLVTALAVNPSGATEPSDYDIVSRVNFGFIFIIAFLAAITCAVFITATYTKRMSLGIPYLIVHGLILLHSFAFFIYLQMVIIEQHRLGNVTYSKAYGFNMVHNNGSYTTLTSILVCCLLLYTLIPLWKFVQECYLLRKEAETRVHHEPIANTGSGQEEHKKLRPSYVDHDLPDLSSSRHHDHNPEPRLSISQGYQSSSHQHRRETRKSAILEGMVES